MTMDELRALATGVDRPQRREACAEIARRLAPEFQGRPTGETRLVGGVLFICFHEGIGVCRWRDLVGGAMVGRNYQRSTFWASIPDATVRGGRRTLTDRARSLESAMSAATRGRITA